MRNATFPRKTIKSSKVEHESNIWKGGMFLWAKPVRLRKNFVYLTGFTYFCHYCDI